MKALNIFVYVVAGATLVGFAFGVLGALVGGPAEAKTVGLVGVGVGAFAGLVFGATRNFR